VIAQHPRTAQCRLPALVGSGHQTHLAKVSLGQKDRHDRPGDVEDRGGIRLEQAQQRFAIGRLDGGACSSRIPPRSSTSPGRSWRSFWPARPWRDWVWCRCQPALVDGIERFVGMLGDHRGGSALEDRFEMMVVGQVESASLLYLGALPLPFLSRTQSDDERITMPSSK